MMKICFKGRCKSHAPGTMVFITREAFTPWSGLGEVIGDANSLDGFHAYSIQILNGGIWHGSTLTLHCDGIVALEQ
jgi:hypothetical protein